MKRIVTTVLVVLALLGWATPALAQSRANKAWQLRSQAMKEQNNSLRYLHSTWFKAMRYRYAVIPVDTIVEASASVGATGAIEMLNPPRGFSTSSLDGPQVTRERISLEAVGQGTPGTTRMQASASYATALALTNNTYNASRVGIGRAEALRRTVAWTNALALSHAQGMWGESWQSPLWTYYLGAGSKKVWSSLSPITRELVTKAVAAEADRLLTIPPPYYRDATGRIISPGDSKSEENAWNASLLLLAARMYSSDDTTKAAQWEAQARWYALTAYATPDQVGKDPRITGSNLNMDGTVVNHGIIHPDYMATSGEMQVKYLLTAWWSNSTEPTECLNEFATVWNGLTRVKFKVGKYKKPGGTIYRVGSHGVSTANIYYPQGTDWSKVRRHNMALMDVSFVAAGHDAGFSWAKAHINSVVKQQARHKDGRIFSAGETRFAEDEQFAAACAAEMVESLRMVH